MSFTYYRLSAKWLMVGDYSTEALAEEMKVRYLSTKPLFCSYRDGDVPLEEKDMSIEKVTVYVDVHLFPEVGANPEFKRARQVKVEAEMAKLAAQMKILNETQ